MPPVGFEPRISAGERPQTYALDRAATGTGYNTHYYYTIIIIIIIISMNVFRITQSMTTTTQSVPFGLFLRFRAVFNMLGFRKFPDTLVK